MAYRMFDIDIKKPLPSITISDEEMGAAVLLRLNGKPVDFLMAALSTNRELKLEQLTHRIGELATLHLLNESGKRDKNPSVENLQFPSLTIAIPTKDRPQHLTRCLESLKKVVMDSRTTNDSIEILVIDNAPSDNRTREVVSSFSGVRYVCEPLQGVCSARNRAIKEASGQLLAYVDDDTVVDRGWLSGLVDAWFHNPTAGAFAGQVLPYELVSDAQVMFEQRGGFRHGFKKICYGQTLAGHFLYPVSSWTFGAGANMAFQKEVLKKLGGFDKVLGPGTLSGGGDDLDLFYRLIRAGYSLQYAPDYLVFHCHRREMKDLRYQYWTWGMGLITFLEKSFRTDPPCRVKIIQLMVWWFGKQIWQCPKSLLGHHALPLNMILAELLGGIQGLWGGYSRSKRKIEKIHGQLVPSNVKR